MDEHGTGSVEIGVGAALSGGVAVLARHPKSVAVWAVVNILLGALSMVAMAMMPDPMQLAPVTADGVVPNSGAPAGFGALFTVVWLVQMIGFVALMAAIVRAATSEAHDRFAFLQLGVAEICLGGTGLVLVVMLVALWLGLLVAAISVAWVLDQAVGPAAAAIASGVLMILAFGALIYIGVRVLLAPILAVQLRRIAIRDSWRATRGRFWTVFAVHAVWQLLSLALMLLFLWILVPSWFSLFASTDPVTQQQAVMKVMAELADLSVGRMLAALVGAVPIALAMVMNIASLAVLADGLTRRHRNGGQRPGPWDAGDHAVGEDGDGDARRERTDG